ncbi:MAG: Nif11-like leader peptide family natural product precursor [Prochlorococcus sp.]
MSEEQLKAFIAKVQGDKSLQEKLNAEGADPVAIAKAAGFSISTEVLQNSIRELSEDELEGVAGGTGVALARTLDEMFREMAKNNEGPWAPGNVFGAK